ncbi:MAG: Bug family tripartite tricarboxylate transporter substrate binding protein [Burkholderiales bacterium]
MMSTRPALVLLALGVAAIAVGLPFTEAAAQSFPTRPIRLIVPYPPGGSTDILARLLAERVSGPLGQPMVVENRSGATGVIGAEAVARSPADGYTVLMGVNGPLSIMPAMRATMPYDSLKDFTPVILTAKAPKLLVVHPSIPANTLQELIAVLRAGPKPLSFASAGVGSTGHLASEMLKQGAKVAMTHVPYKGASPAIADLIAGHVQVVFEVMPQLLPLVQSGKIRALAITSTQRSPVLPNLPTLAESGFPGFESYTWFGIVAPTGTPVAAVNRLNAEFAAVLQTTDMKKRLDELGAEYAPNTPEEFGSFLRADFQKWGRVVREGNIKE